MTRKNYYRKKTDDEINKVIDIRENRKRQWWRIFYYDQLANGNNPKNAYSHATKLVNGNYHDIHEKMIDQYLDDNPKKYKRKS